MRTRLTMITLVTIVLFSGLVPWAAVAQTTPTASTSSLIVKVIAGLTADQQAAVVGRNGGTVTSSIPALRLLVVSVPQDDVAATLARYQADAQVQSAETNKVRVSESMPSDALYANQWALPRIGWDQVFGVVTPTGSAKVALLDTGVDASHPELAGKVVPGTSILDGSDGMTDPSGHGTWLAGIIAARTNNGLEGIAGVAYDGVTVMPVTVLNANGEGQDSDVIAGVVWAADHGADVILMAFSNAGFSPNLQDAIDYAWSKGAVIVASAGNNASSEPHFPAGDRGVIGVAATDQSDGQAFFSNEGQAVFIAAPGVDTQTIQPGGAYTQITGTSAAAAHVAGAAGFMKAVNPALPNGVIVYRLASTADPAGTQVETGNGRINMARALLSTANDFIQPAGADPVGDGGPFVGPYVADSHVLALSCLSPVAVNTSSLCTATLSNGTTGQPSSGRTISFSGGTGAFTPTSCVTAGSNATASCSVSFTPTAAGNHVLTASVTFSAPGHTTSTTFTLNATPNNTPPAIAANNASVTVTEGATANNSGTWSDANAGDTVTLTASVGTVTKAGNNAAGTWTWSFGTNDGPAQSQTVTITANDGKGGITTTTFSLTVSNVAPTATITGAPATSPEGTAISLGSTVTDASSVDTAAGFTLSWTVTKNGNPFSSGSGTSFTFTPDDNDTYVVILSASDKDGGVGTDSKTITVTNVAPTAVITGAPATSPEGTAVSLGSTATDPSSADTAAGFTRSWTVTKNGNPFATGTGMTLSFTPDDNGTYVVTLSANDKDGGVGTDSKTITVTNVAPTATITGAPATSPEGTAISLGSTVTDPGSVDTAAGFTMSWSVTKNGNPFASGTGTTLSFTPDDNGSYVITFSATDKDGGVGTDSKTISVTNVAPTASISGAPLTSPEGTAISLGSTVTDPSSVDTTAGFTRSWTVTKNGNPFASGIGTTLSFTPDDNGSYVVTFSATDKDGGVGTDTKTIAVTNVAPTNLAVSGPLSPVPVNTNVALNVTFTDAGSADTHTCKFYWDDMLAPTTASATSGACTGYHAFPSAGVYTVKVTVTDDDGGTSDTYKFEYVVVYDPSAGFVTGGGWIMSPQGAYRADTLLTGKANFGFVSKYKKGATVPTGETEFQFHAGDFNFHSSTYQYLVITGSKAQYKGEGTVNGSGYYGFMLTATDGNLKGGGPDTFRIKIWDKTNGDAIVYDNVYGNDTEDIDYVQTQNIGGGSIVIHSAK